LLAGALLGLAGTVVMAARRNDRRRLTRGTFAQQSIWFISLQEDEAMKLITTAIASALAFSRPNNKPDKM